MPEDWTNRGVTVVGLLVAAFSLAAGLVSKSVGWGIVCFLLLVAIAVFIQPWIASRLKAGRDRAKAKRVAAEKQAERERLIPILAAWDAFHPAASEVVRLFYDLRDIGRPLSTEEWTTFTEATQRAVSLAASLPGHTRSRAVDLLQPFTVVSKDGLDLCSVQVVDLNDWLTEGFRDHLHAREKVGLPRSA